MSQVKLVPTTDGSNTLFHEDVGEHYHSLKGAVGESRHVFIKYGLQAASLQKSHLQVLEVGFGTGLNALLTMQEAENKTLSIKYTGVETLVLVPAVYEQLDYAKELNLPGHVYTQLMAAKWNEWHKLSKHFECIKINNTIQEVALPAGTFNLIYFDAFAPSRQPEMWTTEVTQKMYDLCAPNGILVTYCAQANFKRNLKAAGFEVERLPGALGKREMTRAIKN
jgi:tRNA U34 5-methylaminomethyl-2-thiouridine-forming methyltransferase MnmC